MGRRRTRPLRSGRKVHAADSRKSRVQLRVLESRAQDLDEWLDRRDTPADTWDLEVLRFDEEEM